MVCTHNKINIGWGHHCCVPDDEIPCTLQKKKKALLHCIACVHTLPQLHTRTCSSTSFEVLHH